MSPKRAGIKQSNVTKLLRKGPSLAQAEHGEEEQDGLQEQQHGWHSSFDNQSCPSLSLAPSVQHKTSLSTCISSLKESGPQLLFVEVLTWIAQFQQHTCLAFCTGTKLRLYVEDIFGPGPHFCLAGAMQFRIRDIVVPQQSAVAFLKDVISSKGQAPPTGHVHLSATGSTSLNAHSARIAAVGNVATSTSSRSFFRRLQSGTHKQNTSATLSTADSACLLVPLSASASTLHCPAQAGIKDEEPPSLSGSNTCGTGNLGEESLNNTCSSTSDSGGTLQDSRQGSPAFKHLEAAPITLEEFVAEAIVSFRISPKHLAQQWEWVEGQYIQIRWTNILPPQLWTDMSVQDAVRALSAQPLAPEVCLNK